MLYASSIFQISGTIANTGHSVIFTVDNDTIYNSYASSSMSSMNSNMQISNQIPVNLTGGPLSYRYRFHEIHIHYGLHDQFGSEHSVEGYTFPAEVNKQIISCVQFIGEGREKNLREGFFKGWNIFSEFFFKKLKLFKISEKN